MASVYVSPTSGSITVGVTAALWVSSAVVIARSATTGGSFTGSTVTDAVPTTLRLVESVARNVKLSAPLKFAAGTYTSWLFTTAAEPFAGWLAMLKVNVSPASGSVTLGVTGALALSSSVVMLALAAVGACATGCPVTVAMTMASRAAKDIRPRRNCLMAANMALIMGGPPGLPG